MRWALTCSTVHAGQPAPSHRVRRQDAAGRQAGRPIGQRRQDVQRVGIHHRAALPVSRDSPSAEKSASTKALCIVGRGQPRPYQQGVVVRAGPPPASGRRPRCACPRGRAAAARSLPAARRPGRRAVARDRQRDEPGAGPGRGRAGSDGCAGVVQRSTGDHRPAEGALVRVGRPTAGSQRRTSSGPINSTWQCRRQAPAGHRCRPRPAGRMAPAPGNCTCPHFGISEGHGDFGGERSGIERTGVAIQPAGTIDGQDGQRRPRRAIGASSSQSSSHSSSSSVHRQVSSSPSSSSSSESSSK